MIDENTNLPADPRQGFIDPEDHYVRAMPAVSVAEVAKLWGLNPHTAKDAADRHGWTEKRKTYRLRVDTAVMETDVEKRRDAVIEASDRHQKLARGLTGEIAMTLNGARRQRANDPDFVMDAKGLNHLAAALLRAQQVERKALGLDDSTPAKEPEETASTKLLLGAIFENGTPEEQSRIREAAITLALAQQQRGK